MKNIVIHSSDAVPISQKKRTDILTLGGALFVAFLMLFQSRILELIGLGKKEPGKVIIPLPDSLSLHFQTMTKKFDDGTNTVKEFTFMWTIRTLELLTGVTTEPDDYGQTGHIRIHFFGLPSSAINSFHSGMDHKAELRYFADDLKLLNEQFRAKFPTVLALVRYLSPSFSFAKLRRLGCIDAALFFAPLHLGSGKLKQLEFESNIAVDYVAWLKERFPDHVEPYYVQTTLNNIVSGVTADNIMPFEKYAKTYPGGLQLLFPYRNQYGEIMRYDALIYDFKDGGKTFVPITQFIGRGSAFRWNFCLPNFEKQLIYNGDLIENAEEPPTVIWCDTVELAEMNQKEAPADVVFVSAQYDEGHFEEVDTAPLLKAQEIIILIMNNAGEKLEDAYLRAEVTLAELRSVKGLETVKIGFLQADIEYPAYRIPYDLDSFLATREQAMGQIVDGNQFELSEEEFHTMVEKATKSLATPIHRFWERNDVPAVPAVESGIPSAAKKIMPQYIIHPWIIRGEQTSIYAKKNHGKSLFGFHIAAAAVAYKEKGAIELVLEKTIVVAKTLSQYPSNKVFYADFENGRDECNERKDSIGALYWPNPKKAPEGYRKSADNFIIESFREETQYAGIDFSKPENHQIILDKIEAATNQGTPGQKVDLVVIDTYNKFVKTENVATNAGFSALSAAIRKMGIALLVIGQAGEDEKVRGFKQKLDDDYVTILLYRDDDSQAHSPETTPVKVKIKNHRGRLTDEQLAEFGVLFPRDKKIEFVKAADDNRDVKEIAAASLDGYIDRYQKLGYNVEQIAPVIGMSKTTLYDLIDGKKAKKRK